MNKPKNHRQPHNSGTNPHLNPNPNRPPISDIPSPISKTTPLPKGWEEATVIYGGRRYPFIYNPDTRRVHAPGFPHLPLHGIQLHTGEIINHFELQWDVETELGYVPGDEDQPPRPPIGWKPTAPSS